MTKTNTNPNWKYDPTLGMTPEQYKILIANANMIAPIQTYEDPRERLRKWTDPKRYANPDSPDGRWPRRIKYGKGTLYS